MTDKQETKESAPTQEQVKADAQEIRGFVKIDAASYTRLVAERAEAMNAAERAEARADTAAALMLDAMANHIHLKDNANAMRKELDSLKGWLAGSDYLTKEFEAYKQRHKGAGKADAAKEGEVA